MPIINVNGKAYDGGDVNVMAFGRLDFEVTEITYDKEQEHTENHHLGSNESSSYSMGKISKKASWTLRLKSISSIEKAVGGELLKIKPFPVVVTYTNEDNDIITDIITMKFKNQGRKVDGGMDIKQQFDMHVTEMQFNVV